MRFDAMMRLTALASLSLLVSGQLCMLTTCVPRLRELPTATAHACCRTPASDDAPADPLPPGAMPCDQAVSLADAPALAAPELLAPAPSCAPAPEPAHALPPGGDGLDRERDTGPLPGRDGPAPTGLRAPPLA